MPISLASGCPFAAGCFPRAPSVVGTVRVPLFSRVQGDSLGAQSLVVACERVRLVSFIAWAGREPRGPFGRLRAVVLSLVGVCALGNGDPIGSLVARKGWD